VADGDRELIAQWCAQGKAAWPAFDVGIDELAAVCAGRQVAAIADGKELYLAVACARGDRAALDVFDAQYAPSVKQALRRLELSADDHADVMQLVRVRLVVAQEGKTPRIVEYAGSGRLGALVYVAATRIALNLLRARQRIDDSDLTALDPADPDGLDLADQLGKQEYRAELRTAFAEAVHQLEKKERTLLRLSVIDGMSIDELGTMYRVHRATVARWIASARDRLTELARDRFLALTGLSASDLASVGELVASQIQVSMERLLRTTQIKDP
jgi:RNA polymerase sigma-70 factor (ECF subfamily)